MDVEHGGMAAALLYERKSLGHGRSGACDFKTRGFKSPAKLESHKRVILDHQYSCFHGFLSARGLKIKRDFKHSLSQALKAPA